MSYSWMSHPWIPLQFSRRAVPEPIWETLHSLDFHGERGWCWEEGERLENPWEGTRDHGALLWEPAHYQLPPPAFMVGIIIKALFTNEETGLEKIPWTSDTQPELCRAGIPHEYLEFLLLLQQHTTLEFKLHRADCLTTQRACNECAIWTTFPENSQGFLTCLCRVHTCILLCTGYRRTEHRKIKCERTPLKKETRNLNKPPCAVL